jgi:hypothetical protein
MSVLDHTTATTADGPAVIAWLEEHEDLRRLTPHARRTTDRWRRGVQASFWTLDRVLNELGRHPSELPESVWVDYRLRRAQG